MARHNHRVIDPVLKATLIVVALIVLGAIVIY